MKENKKKEEEVKDKNESAEVTDNTETSGSEKETANAENSENADKESEANDPLAEANAKIEELKDKYLRCMADFDNFRKHALKEKQEYILNGSERAVTTLLPVLDDLERAITNADKVDSVEDLKKGQELILQNFEKAFKSLGVTRIDTENKDFDTDYHEAIAMVPGQGDDKKGKVIDCVQSGYMLNDKVIRHAKVAVGQ
jgi:molecular chaperone GrpE